MINGKCQINYNSYCEQEAKAYIENKLACEYCWWRMYHKTRNERCSEKYKVKYERTKKVRN